jgi:hypothetical protein
MLLNETAAPKAGEPPPLKTRPVRAVHPSRAVAKQDAQVDSQAEQRNEAPPQSASPVIALPTANRGTFSRRSPAPDK